MSLFKGNHTQKEELYALKNELQQYKDIAAALSNRLPNTFDSKGNIIGEVKPIDLQIEKAGELGRFTVNADGVKYDFIIQSSLSMARYQQLQSIMHEGVFGSPAEIQNKLKVTYEALRSQRLGDNDINYISGRLNDIFAVLSNGQRQSGDIIGTCKTLVSELSLNLNNRTKNAKTEGDVIFVVADLIDTIWQLGNSAKLNYPLFARVAALFINELGEDEAERVNDAQMSRKLHIFNRAANQTSALNYDFFLRLLQIHCKDWQPLYKSIWESETVAGVIAQK